MFGKKQMGRWAILPVVTVPAAAFKYWRGGKGEGLGDATFPPLMRLPEVVAAFSGR